MTNVVHEMVKAATKAARWSRFVILLAFGLLALGLPRVQDWTGLGVLIGGVTAFIALAFGVELLQRRFFSR